MKHFFLLCTFFGVFVSLSAQTKISVSVTNPSKTVRNDQPVVIPLENYGDVRSARVSFGDDAFEGNDIPCQLDDLDQDEIFDELCFLADLKPRQTKTYTVTFYDAGEPREYESRVYAEMLMRNDKVKEKNRHDNFIESITARGDCANSYNLQHHHGVDFESELNGIRIYFDKRQTVDIYGKFKKRLELKETQFYTTADQKKQNYGDDVLWVGNTFGLGAFRGWDGFEPTMVEPVKSRTQRIISYGPLRTIVEVIDRGWKADASLPPVNMTLRYTQYAGHRDTDVEVLFNREMKDYTFSTGLINVKDSREFSDHSGLRACWGTDYPSTDTLKWNRETVGLAILVPDRYIKSEEPANKDNYTFLVNMLGYGMEYKICYCSANEEFGFHSADEWFKWLEEWKKEVEKPVIVKLEAKK
jgi:hypothetical protein